MDRSIQKEFVDGWREGSTSVPAEECDLPAEDQAVEEERGLTGGELRLVTKEDVADADEREGFSSLDEVKAFLKEELSKPIKKEKHPLWKVPTYWLEELIYEAITTSIAKGKPPARTTLEFDVGGTVFSVSKNKIKSNGRKDDYNQSYELATVRYLSCFERVCEFLAVVDVRIFQRHGGWNRLKPWWAKIMEKAAKQNPMMPIKSLTLIYNGKTINTPYKFVRQHVGEPELSGLVLIHERARDDYLEESFENVLEYAFTSKSFSWSKVPEKWHRAFCKLAFEQNPFANMEDLKLVRNGVSKRIPINHYVGNSRRSELTKMMDGIFEEYLDSMPRLVAYVKCDGFSPFGGWTKVPEKLKRRVIVLSVIQNGKRGTTFMKYACNGKEIKLYRLYVYYQKAGQLDVFNACVQKGLELRVQIQKDDGMSPEREKGGDLVPAPEREMTHEEELAKGARRWELPAEFDDEKVRVLIAKAQAGDQDARAAIVGKFNRTIRFLAKRYAHPSTSTDAYDELVADGIEQTLRCIDSFELERRIAKFNTYLYKILEREFKIRWAVYVRGDFLKNTIKVSLHVGKFIEKGGNAGDYKDLPPEEIAAMTGQQVKTVAKNQMAMSISYRPFVARGDEKIGLHETVADDMSVSPEEVCACGGFNESVKGLVVSILGELDLRERVIARQFFGIKAEERLTLQQLEEISNGKTGIADLEAATTRFREGLRSFCDSPTIMVSSHMRAYIYGMLGESENFDELIDGGNALGRFLKDDLPPELEPIFTEVVEGMDRKDAMILSEVFSIPLKAQKKKHIGRFLGLTGERVRQLLVKIVPKLKESLSRDHGITEGRGFYADEPEMIRWDRLR